MSDETTIPFFEKEVRTFWVLVLYCAMAIVKAKYLPGMDDYVFIVILGYMGKRVVDKGITEHYEAKVAMNSQPCVPNPPSQ